MESLKSLKSWLKDVIGDSSGQINIFNNINSYSSFIFNTGTLGKLPSNIIKLFNRGFLAAAW